jgi:hypothetical protein
MTRFEEWAISRGSSFGALATRRATRFYLTLGYEGICNLLLKASMRRAHAYVTRKVLFRRPGWTDTPETLDPSRLSVNLSTLPQSAVRGSKTSDSQWVFAMVSGTHISVQRQNTPF